MFVICMLIIIIEGSTEEFILFRALHRIFKPSLVIIEVILTEFLQFFAQAIISLCDISYVFLCKLLIFINLAHCKV